MRTLIATGFTPGYADLEGRLRASCEALGLDIYSESYESTGDWVKNGHVKPRLMLNAMRANPGRPVAWVDADAVIRSRPVLLDACEELDLDVAYHVVPKTQEALSGTVWVHGNAFGFLREWADGLRVCPTAWDQHVIDAAVRFSKAKWARLPAEYCWIDYFAEPRWGGPRVPVIEHTQASREVRAGTRQM